MYKVPANYVTQFKYKVLFENSSDFLRYVLKIRTYSPYLVTLKCVSVLKQQYAKVFLLLFFSFPKQYFLEVFQLFNVYILCLHLFAKVFRHYCKFKISLLK